jgi:hypothetical protein
MLEVGFYWTIVAGAPQPLQELAVREFREGKWRECGDEVGTGRTSSMLRLNG